MCPYGMVQTMIELGKLRGVVLDVLPALPATATKQNNALNMFSKK
jgi:hypothetical protein